MNSRKKYIILQWINLFAFLVLIFIEFFHPIVAITQDLGRHIRTGEIILNSKSVPSENLFSYTNPHFHLINTEWFSQVIFYIIYKLLGFHGLLLITTMIAILAFVIISLPIIKKVNITALSITFLLYLGILFERTDIRPETFSFFFLSLFIAILYRFKNTSTRLVLFLPLLELFWVNMHIYFIIGILVVWLFLVDEIIAQRHTVLNFINKNKKLPSSLTTLATVTILTTLVTLINPNGLARVIYPFHVFDNYSYSVAENQGILLLQGESFSPTIALFEFVLILFFILMCINYNKNPKETRIIDWFLLICFSLIAFYAYRNLPLFVFATFIPFATNLSTFFDTKKVQNNTYKVAGFIVITCLFFTEAYTFINISGFGWRFPLNANSGVDFIIKNNIKGPIYNNFNIGSYLIYRLYPKEKVFIDGRPEAYPKNFGTDIDTRSKNDPSYFKTLVYKYNINTIAFAITEQTSSTTNFEKSILHNKEWVLVYLDNYIFILVRNNKKNKNIISKFGLNTSNYIVDKENLKDENSIKYLGRFFENAGWINQEIIVLKALVQKNPNDCSAVRSLAILSNNSFISNEYPQCYN